MIFLEKYITEGLFSMKEYDGKNLQSLIESYGVFFKNYSEVINILTLYRCLG